MSDRDLFSVGMVVISVVLLTMVLLAMWLQGASKNGTGAAVESVLTTRTESAASWVADYVDATETTTHGLAQWMAAEARSHEQIRAQLLVTAAIDGHLSTSGVGFADGSWIGIRKAVMGEGGAWILSSVAPAGDGWVRDYEVYDEEFSLLLQGTEADATPSFEFTFWKPAVESAESVWVTAEPAANISNVGVWAAEAVRDPAAELVAVVASEFPVDAMTEVLEAVVLGEGGGVFLLDEQRTVIASPWGAEDVASVSVGASPAPTFDSLEGRSLESLGVSTDSPAEPQDAAVVIGYDGEAHTAELGLQSQGVPWVLHLRALDEQVASAIFELQVAMKWASGIMLAVLALASGLFFFFWRPARDLQVRANTDMLTGLLRRPRFMDLAPQALTEARRLGHTSCVVVLDLDNFKTLNDSQGHEAGDLALERVGLSLRSATRSGDLVSRWGGDEFVVLMELLDRDDALFAVERLRAQVEARLREEFPSYPDLGVTAGGMVSRGEDDSVEMLVRAADEALVEGKRTRKSRSYMALV